MQCPYCNGKLTAGDNCEKCGNNVKPFKKLYKISNRCYNEGLEKAKVRDLSGAVVSLQNSLKINKRNTDARNLLGLIYSEMGEIVDALSEWVISNHLQPENNLATGYLSYFQNNPTRLDAAEQVVKKYNTSLKLAKAGSYDLAVIQLKKLISLNSKHIKGLQLLGLLNIKSGNLPQAKKYLKMMLKVDAMNPAAMLYLKEIQGKDAGEDKTEDVDADRLVLNARESFAPTSAYRENKHGILPWINLLLGIVLGMAFFMVAIVPGIRAKSVENKKAEIVSLNETLAKTNAEFDSMTSENAELKKKVETLETKNKQLSETVKKPENNEYGALAEAAAYYTMEDNAKAAEALLKVDKTTLKDKNLLNLYNQLSAKVFEEQSAKLFQEGYNTYNRGKYEDALKIFETSLKMNTANVDSVYFTGRCYDRLSDKEKAVEWYNKVINEFGNTQRAVEAKRRLRALGV
ncbi:MAG: tetratricopeptide repeat protein [Catonella sp.]